MGREPGPQISLFAMSVGILADRRWLHRDSFFPALAPGDSWALIPSANTFKDYTTDIRKGDWLSPNTGMAVLGEQVKIIFLIKNKHN